MARPKLEIADIFRAHGPAWRRDNARHVIPMKRSASQPRPESFIPDTMAARNGKKLSERDKDALDEDFDELFDDDAWNDDQDESDK